jgi:prepilin peptidase CpaA
MPSIVCIVALCRYPGELSLPHPLLQIVLALVAGLSALSDLRSRTIPNWLTGGGLAAAVLAQVAVHGWLGAQAAGLGFGVATLIYVPLFLLRVMGGGDVKMMAAIGAAVGPGNWLAIFLITSILGGPIALVTILLRGRFGKTMRNIGAILWQLARLRAPHEADPELDVAHPKSVGLPHGAVIALGVAVFLVLARFAK